MTPGALLCVVHRAGVRLRAEGQRLLYEGPRQALTPDLLAQLRARKPELLALLTDPAPPLPDPLTELAWWPAAMHQTCIELEEALAASGADHAAERAFAAVSAKLTPWCWEMNRRPAWGNAEVWEGWAVVWEGEGAIAVGTVDGDGCHQAAAVSSAGRADTSAGPPAGNL